MHIVTIKKQKWSIISKKIDEKTNEKINLRKKKNEKHKRSNKLKAHNKTVQYI